jgi:hypothetical protein
LKISLENVPQVQKVLCPEQKMVENPCFIGYYLVTVQKSTAKSFQPFLAFKNLLILPYGRFLSMIVMRCVSRVFKHALWNE